MPIQTEEDFGPRWEWPAPSSSSKLYTHSSSPILLPQCIQNPNYALRRRTEEALQFPSAICVCAQVRERYINAFSSFFRPPPPQTQAHTLSLKHIFSRCPLTSSHYGLPSQQVVSRNTPTQKHAPENGKFPDLVLASEQLNFPSHQRASSEFFSTSLCAWPSFFYSCLANRTSTKMVQHHSLIFSP